MTFEEGFASTERAAAAAAKAVAVLAGAVRQFQKAALEGDLQNIRKWSERLTALLTSASQEIASSSSAWPFTAQEEEAYFRDAYAAEMISTAKAEGLQIQQRDEGLVAFPSIVRILPGERAVRVNKMKVQAIRPSRLVKLLKAQQAKKAKSTSESFLELLHRAYRLIAGGEYGKTVTLAGIYDVLTLLPGSNSIYDQTDFVRDLFLLDQSGIAKTRSGAVCSLPASTGTKGEKGKFSFISPAGENITYYGIRFEQAAV